MSRSPWIRLPDGRLTLAPTPIGEAGSRYRVSLTDAQIKLLKKLLRETAFRQMWGSDTGYYIDERPLDSIAEGALAALDHAREESDHVP